MATTQTRIPVRERSFTVSSILAATPRFEIAHETANAKERQRDGREARDRYDLPHVAADEFEMALRHLDRAQRHLDGSGIPRTDIDYMRSQRDITSLRGELLGELSSLHRPLAQEERIPQASSHKWPTSIIP